jgi:hypothetical protein
MLTWSRGLKAMVDLEDEKTDQEIVDGEKQQDSETVAVIPSDVWDGIRDDRDIACAMLEAAELALGPREGFEAIQALIRVPISRAPP